MKSNKEYRFKDNPKEKEFFDKFIESHSKNNDMDFIVFGQEIGRIGFYPQDYLTEREESIVLSTIQWLGSPVGQGFLRDCGFIEKSEVR